MKSKECDLLLYLFNYKGQFVTSKELSKVLSISERTVRTYIKNLQIITDENGAEIVAKQGYGYQLNTKRPMQFEMFIKKERFDTCDHKLEKDFVDTSDERQNYILNKLLLREEQVFLETLADKLYISRSTLTKEMNYIKKLLEPYDLCLLNKSNKGVRIIGDESNKRSFIMDYFFKEIQFNSIQEYAYQTSYFDDMPIAKLIMIILEECRNLKIKLSDVMVQNVLIHLMLSIKRIDKDLEWKQFKVDFSDSDNVEVIVAERIIRRIEEEMNICFPPEEIAYLTLHLGAKNNRTFEVNGISMSEMEKELESVLQMMDEETGFSLSSDRALKKNLIEHLRPMLMRVEQSVNLKNPLLSDILRDYKDIFEITKAYLCKMPSLSKIEIDDDEWAYLTLHFMAAMERMKQRSGLQALVICSTGHGSAQLLKSRIQKEFGDKLNIIAEIGYFELNEEILEGIDLIISSVNISSVITGVPSIHVSVFLGEKDITKIRTFVDGNLSGKKQTKEEYPVKLSQLEKEEIFHNYIQKDKFLVFQGEAMRTEVVKALVSCLEKEEKELFSSSMMDQIDLREKMSQIVFSDSVAVPHPAIPVGEKGGVALAVIPNGIKWDDDYQNIKFVFLISPSRIGNQKIKYIGQTIVRFIDHPELQDALIETQTFETFQDIFLSLM